MNDLVSGVIHGSGEMHVMFIAISSSNSMPFSLGFESISLCMKENSREEERSRNS